ncbi:hypothetical protein [Actinomadura gamaensis]|uniref:DUF3592 domain-containing protein n=1 Tax=Actinomadura gamaensis TaxID=1763541 RepID=A0ABV9TSI9_9ACTN
MSRTHRPGPSRAAVLRHRFGFDSNPLRRDVDRFQWLTGLVLVLLFLVFAPVMGLRVGEAYYAKGVRTERVEATAWRPVSADVTRVTERKRGYRVDVLGTAADGHRLTGSYTTSRATVVGDHVSLWATPSRLTDTPPRRHARTITDTVVAVAASTLVVAAPLALVHLVTRRRCDRLRSRLWDAAWARFDRHPTP